MISSEVGLYSAIYLEVLGTIEKSMNEEFHTEPASLMKQHRVVNTAHVVKKRLVDLQKTPQKSDAYGQ